MFPSLAESFERFDLSFSLWDSHQWFNGVYDLFDFYRISHHDSIPIDEASSSIYFTILD